MARYQIETAKGPIIVEGPAGLSGPEVIDIYNDRLKTATSRRVSEFEGAQRGQFEAQVGAAETIARSQPRGVLDYLGEIPKGLTSGAAGMVEQGALGLAALLPEGAEDVVRGGIKAVGGAVQDYVAPDFNLEESIPRKVSEAGGSFVGLAGVSMLNPYAGAALAVSAGAGEASERARAAGATEDERSLAALWGIIPGALELLPIGFLKVLGKDGVRSILNTTARVLTEGGVEAAQETTTAIIQNLIAQGIYKPDQKLIEGVGEQAALGGTVGAIVQGLIELATPRTRGGTGTAVDAGPQGELFSGEDLGRAPQRQEPTPDQAEMFPTEDLGQAPEGPDPRQGDLFAAPEETLARRAKELEREKEAVMRRPMGEAIAEFEAKDDKFFERNKRERDAARAGIASLEAAKRRPETTTRDMRDMVAESQDQVADEQARDREGLAAAERGDVAAFEQPDLFAQELESEQRRLGPKELRDPEQYMDATLFEETETPEFVRPAAERDLVDLINQDKAREDNAAVRSGKLAAQEADLAGRTQDQTRLKAESAAETAQGTIEARRTAQTTATRTKVLQDTIANAGEIRKPEALRKLYEDALAREGIADTKAKPAEMESLRRASDVIRAKDPAVETIAAREEVKDPRQLAMEARVAPRDRKSKPLATVITADMLPQPLKGRTDAASGIERATPIADGRGASAEGAIQGGAAASSDGASAGQDTQKTPTPDAGRVGPPVSSTADAPAGTVAQPSALEPTYPAFKKEAVDQAAKQNDKSREILVDMPIDDFLAAAKQEKSPEKLAAVKDLLSKNIPFETVPSLQFANNGDGTAKVVSHDGRHRAMALKERGETTIPVRLTSNAGKGGKGDAIRWGQQNDSKSPDYVATLPQTLIAEDSDAKVAMPAKAKDIRKTPTTKQVTQKATPTPGAAEATSPSVKQTTQEDGSIVRNVVPTFPERTTRTKTEGGVRFEGTPASQPKAAPKTSTFKGQDLNSEAADKARAEKQKSNTADEAHTEIFKAQPENIQSQGVADTDMEAPAAPIKAADKNKILRLMNVKRTKTNASQLANAVQRYFNQFPSFTAALDAVIYDVGMQIPNRNRSDNEYKTNTELAEFYCSDEKNNLPSMGKTSARRITDWLTSEDSNMSAELKKYVKARLQEESQARVAQANYQKTEYQKKDLANLSPEELAARETNLYKLTPEGEAARDARAKRELPAELVIDTPIRPAVRNALLKGDLKGALEALQFTAGSKDIALLAKKLSENVGDTKLVTKKNLKADDGAPVAGYFDPETNTISLDTEAGMNAHAVLHEMFHAVTSTTTANKAHPLTKKLTRIFEGVQEQLAGEYGLTSLDEFVAEYQTNADFANQLKTTTVNGRNPWQQLVRAVSNYIRTLLGRPTVAEDSTFDAVDKLVQEIISPNYDTRAATKIYMQIKTPAGAGKLINGMAANVVNVVKEKGWYEAARDWVGGATPPKAKSVFLDFMELRILSELASKKIPEALKLNDLVNNMSDNLKVENKRLLPIIADLTNLMAKNKKDFATLRFLLPNSSAERIDPRVKDFDKAYGRDKGDVDAVKLAKVIHKDLHAEWNSMGAEGKRLYSTVTNMFESRFDDAMDSIKENIRVMFGEDAAKAEATIKNLAEKLGIDRGRIRPYMPLGRDGNYRLEFNTLDPRTKRPEQFVEYYATAKLRNKAKDNIKAYEDKLRAELPKGDVGLEFLGQTPLEGMRDSTSNFDKAPQGSFVANVLNTLKADGVDSASINSIIELAIDSMPERSFMQAFRTRKDTRGFLGDVTPTGMAQEAFDLIDTVQSKGRDYNRQVVQMQFGAKIQALKNEINEKYKYKDIDESTSLFKKKLLKIADFAQAPNVSRLSQNITGAAYAWTMGLNLSSAATAVFDVPMSVYPRLAGKFGDKNAVYALAAAVRMLSNSPKESITETYGAEIDPATGKPIMVKRKINEGFAGYSNTNYDFDEIRAMSKAEMDKAGMSQKERQEILDTEVLVEVGSRSAQYNSSLNHEHLDVTRGKDQANFLGLKINMETVNAFSSFLFHHSERYSREVTMQAAYRLELNRLRDKPNNTEKKLSDLEKKYIAAEYAVSETQLSLGATASAGRPIISQNAIGNVAMLFKRFAISKYYMMARMTDEAFKNAKTADEKAMRSMARGQLGRFMVTSAAFAGVAGMPLMGAIGQIYDLFADEEDDTFDAVLLKTFGEPFSSGLINAALGVDMASRINMNSLLYRPPIIEKDQPAAYTLLEQLGGPAVGIYLSFDRGYDLFNEGEFVKGTEAILPAAFRNVLKGVQQLYTGEVATRRGNAVVEDIGLGQILAQFAGFANADVIRQYAINKNERRKDTYLTTTRTRLLRAANIAAAERDTDGYKDAMKRIREYNKNLPRASRSKLIILPETIEKSRTSFNIRTSNMIGGIEYTPQMRQSLKEYDQGLFD
jgi:hypothetical protein